MTVNKEEYTRMKIAARLFNYQSILVVAIF